MLVVDASCLKQADSQPKSDGLVWGSAAAWRWSTFIKWTEWTLAMTCGHDDTIINIVMGIIIIIIIIIIANWHITAEERRAFSTTTSVSRYQNVSSLCFIEAKHDGSMGDNWSYNSCKAPVKLSPSTNQNPTSYKPDALSVTQPTVSKHWREKSITFHGLDHLNISSGLPTFSLTTKGSWLPWWKACQASRQMPVASSVKVKR